MGQDNTTAMPERPEMDQNEAIMAAFSGQQPEEVNASEQNRDPFGSSLDNLEADSLKKEMFGEQNEEAPAEEQPDTQHSPNEEAKEEPKGEVEVLKVNGKEMEIDFSDRESLKTTLQKGLAAQQKLKSAKQIKRQNEELKQQLESLKSQGVEGLTKAKQLADNGRHEDAVKSLLGESYDKWMQSKVDELVEYRTADPARKAELEAKWDEQKRQQEYDERQQEIERLREELESEREGITEQQYATYLENARSTYDLSKHIDDPDVAADLNEELQITANQKIIREQSRREEEGKPDLSEKDIKQIYYNEARKKLSLFKKYASKQAESQVEEQATKAKEQAQMASQKNYKGENSAIEKWQKKGGTMTDLVAMLAGQKSVL